MNREETIEFLRKVHIGSYIEVDYKVSKRRSKEIDQKGFVSFLDPVTFGLIHDNFLAEEDELRRNYKGQTIIYYFLVNDYEVIRDPSGVRENSEEVE